MHRGRVCISGLREVFEVGVDSEECQFWLGDKSYDLSDLSLNPPTNGTIYGTMFNYQGVINEFRAMFSKAPYHELPKAPVLYLKPANTVIGYGMPIPLPDGVDKIQVGASLGVVFGRTATRVRKEEALECIAGFTIVNDVTIPHENFFRPAISQKCRDGFCPIGPWVIERSAVPDFDSLMVRVFINNELRQENTTRNLIRSVPQLIQDVTEFMTLSTGDVLLVGVPEGAPVAQEGDCVRIEIDGVGCLENLVVRGSEAASAGGSSL